MTFSASGWVSPRIRTAGVRLLPWNAPLALVRKIDALYSLAPAGQGAPAALFPYRVDGAPSPIGDPTGGVKITMQSTKAQYLWDPATGTWPREENGSPHVDHDDVQIAPANVVVQFVSYVGVPGVGQSQQAVTVGEGEAWILTDGKIIKGTWSR